MRVNSKTLKHPLFLLAFVAVAIFINSCRTDEVDTPPLTGPSGTRLFLVIEASPDHLVIRKPGVGRDHSTITIQLKNQLGQGVPNERVKIRILNSEGSEVNIGNLSQLEGVTDAGGFIRLRYTAPNSAEQSATTRIYVWAALLDPAFANEVTDRRALDLEFAQPPVNCVIGGPGSPTPDFTFTPGAPTIHQPVCFDAQGSSDNGVIVASVWNFGDGGTATGLNVCHTFRHEGIFNVTLTIQDNDRNCASLTQTVTVTSTEPECAFTISPTPIVIDQDEIFSAQTSADVDNDITGFQWDFGDNTTGSGKIVHHTFHEVGTFVVTLTVRDSAGNTTVCTQNVTVTRGLPPVCELIATPATGVKGTEVTLDASGSSDPDGTIVSYEFDFGEGGSFGPAQASATTTHVYNNTGTFTARVRITDNDGNEVICEATVTITAGTPPTCGTIIVSPNGTIDTGTTVTVDATSASDVDGTISTFEFNFGEGGGFETSAGPNPAIATHQYNNSGTFTITVRLTDNDGNITICPGGTVTVAAPAAPTCAFSVSPSPACTGSPVTVDATASTPPTGETITSFAWDFSAAADANPQTSSGSVTNVTYSTAGLNKRIDLLVTASNATTCSLTHFVNVFDVPVIASFSGGTCGGASTLTLTGTGFISGGTQVSIDGGPLQTVTVNGTGTQATLTVNFATGSGPHSAQIFTTCGSSNVLPLNNCP